MVEIDLAWLSMDNTVAPFSSVANASNRLSSIGYQIFFSSAESTKKAKAMYYSLKYKSGIREM